LGDSIVSAVKPKGFKVIPEYCLFGSVRIHDISVPYK
jgi:hypothetical protein